MHTISRLALLTLALGAGAAQAVDCLHGTAYTTVGAASCDVPAGVTRMTVVVVGGGGGGGNPAMVVQAPMSPSTTTQ